jgi:hypothetical protein
LGLKVSGVLEIKLKQPYYPLFSTFDQNNELVDRRPIEGPVILVAETGADGKLKLVEKYGQKRWESGNRL